MSTIAEIIARWDSGEGKPYKGSLIDWTAYEANPDDIGCMCAQGQVLALAANWTPDDLRDADQFTADTETAKLLNISRAHAVLLRNINDRADGAPSIVLTDPGRVLGDQWSKLLDFWWMFHRYESADWQKVVAAVAAVGAATEVAARAAAEVAAVAAAMHGARAAAEVAAVAAVGAATEVAAKAAAWEIQGLQLLGGRGRDVFFLPMFGFKTLDDIPARPADYGHGIVPTGAA